MVGMHSVTAGDPLDDADCRRILLVTSRQELTGPAIAYILDLPLAITYRKVAALVRGGYLVVAGYTITPRHRAHKVYRAKLDGVQVYYSRDRLMMRVPRRGAGLGGMEIEVVVPPKRRSKG